VPAALSVDFWDGASWNTDVIVHHSDSANWIRFSLDLSPFTLSGDIQFLFIVDKTPWGSDNIFILDDIYIGEVITCHSPSGLHAENLTQSSAELYWTPGGGELLWNIEYGSSGFPNIESISNKIELSVIIVS